MDIPVWPFILRYVRMVVLTVIPLSQHLLYLAKGSVLIGRCGFFREGSRRIATHDAMEFMIDAEPGHVSTSLREFYGCLVAVVQLIFGDAEADFR